MPLKLTLGMDEKLIVNGAVIRSRADGVSLVFENQAHILRQKDILTADNATTPAARVYLALQCAYLFPERRAAHLKDFHGLLADYVEAAPSAEKTADAIRVKVAADQLYNALKQCRRLIDHETELLRYVH